MPSGLQTFRDDGTLLTSYTDRIARVLGVQAIGTGSGSFSHPGLLTGTPFYIFTAGTLVFSLKNSSVSASISQGVVNWSNLGDPCSIIFGVY